MPTLHLLAGLPGAGKTTLARRICDEAPAVRFTLDEWMLRLYGLSYDDPSYGDRAVEVRELIWDSAQQVLRAGIDVVLDWSQWSRAKRAEWKQRATENGWAVVLHYVATPADVSVERLANRSAAYSHNIDAAGVTHMERLFEPPTADEGLTIRRHDPS